MSGICSILWDLVEDLEIEIENEVDPIRETELAMLSEELRVEMASRGWKYSLFNRSVRAARG